MCQWDLSRVVRCVSGDRAVLPNVSMKCEECG